MIEAPTVRYPLSLQKLRPLQLALHRLKECCPQLTVPYPGWPPGQDDKPWPSKFDQNGSRGRCLGSGYNRKKSSPLAGPFVRARAKGRLVEAESQQVTLEIGLHPELSKTQKKFIALDYGMSGGKVQIAVRRAPLYYALRPLGPDTEPSARPPEDQKIVSLNAAEIIG